MMHAGILVVACETLAFETLLGRSESGEQVEGEARGRSGQIEAFLFSSRNVFSDFACSRGGIRRQNIHAGRSDQSLDPSTVMQGGKGRKA